VLTGGASLSAKIASTASAEIQPLAESQRSQSTTHIPHTTPHPPLLPPNTPPPSHQGPWSTPLLEPQTYANDKGLPSTTTEFQAHTLQVLVQDIPGVLQQVRGVGKEGREPGGGGAR
jgi:hypothetical protein